MTHTDPYDALVEAIEEAWSTLHFTDTPEAQTAAAALKAAWTAYDTATPPRQETVTRSHTMPPHVHLNQLRPHNTYAVLAIRPDTNEIDPAPATFNAGTDIDHPWHIGEPTITTTTPHLYDDRGTTQQITEQLAAGLTPLVTVQLRMGRIELPLTGYLGSQP